MDEKVFEMPNFKSVNVSPKTIAILIAVGLGVLLLFSSFYQVDPEEVGVVLQFGKYNRTTGPGLHFKVPLVEDYILVPVQRQLKQEFGFRTVQSNIRSSFARQGTDESLMLTGDLNVAVVEWIVQYRVSDPFKYLFRVRGVTETFRAMNEAVMRRVVGDRTVTEVLTVGRQEVELTVKLALQQMCDTYETGITVDQVVLQNVTPPDPVKPSWDQVNQAQQQRDRMINEAQTEFNQEIPRARGEALQLVLQSEGYRTNRVNRSQGDAARFTALANEYRKAPEVTRQRLYLETIERVLPKMGGKLLLDSQAEGVLPLLPLDAFGRARMLPAGGSNDGGSQ